MLKPHRLGIASALCLLAVAGALLALTANQAGVGPPLAGGGASDVLAASGGLLIEASPDNTGLIILAALPTAPRREVARLEMRAQVGGTWQPGVSVAPAARPRVHRYVPETVIEFEEVRFGDMASSKLTLTLKEAAPGGFMLQRTDRLLRPREVTAIALAVTSASNAPEERLVLLSGTAYALRDGWPRDRLGGMGPSGLVNRDPHLSFTLSDGGASRVMGRRLTAAAEAGRPDTWGQDELLLQREREATGSATTQVSTMRFDLGPVLPLQTARSSFAPAMESFLLTAGYYGNVFVSSRNGSVLTASMGLYPDSVWMRDVAAASGAYLYVAPGAAVVRNTLEQFIQRTSYAGVVPEYFDEAGEARNRDAWDPMPDLIHAVYAYVSQTGDVAFFSDNREVLRRVVGWITALDSDDDGLPDRDIFPYGYFDSVENGVMHTYAIASFYAALVQMGELEAASGGDAGAYRRQAERMRQAYNRPVDQGGYWQPQLGYPIAWKKGDRRQVTGFETFGVLTAVRAGLIDSKDALDGIARVLCDRRDELVNGDGVPPLRLMLGGYDEELLRPGVPPERRWLLDANAPWQVGHDVAVRWQLCGADDADGMLKRYQQVAVDFYPPMPEFVAGPGARYGDGNTGDGGRLWDNAAWFDAVYTTHYGLWMTPQELIIQPRPLRQIPDDTVEGIVYQGLRLRLTLKAEGYRVEVLDGPERQLLLRPPGRCSALSVNGEAPQPERMVKVKAGEIYTVRASGCPAG